MKKIILFLSAFMIHAALSAQWINSISMQPLNPSAADTIRFYVNLSFPSGNCDEHTQYHFVAPPYVEAYALHCLGMLTFICNHTDTFEVNPLPDGNYTFRFSVDAGTLPSPCVPGGNPGPVDSLFFQVGPFTMVSEFTGIDWNVQLADGEMIIENRSEAMLAFSLVTLSGSEVLSGKATPGITTASIRSLPYGVYFIKAEKNGTQVTRKIIYLKKE